VLCYQIICTAKDIKGGNEIMSSQQPYDYYNQEPSPQPSYQQQPYQQQQFYPPVTSTPAEPGKGLAVAGLVLGIISLVFCFVPYIGFPVSIVGIFLAAFGRRSITRRTMATVGLVLSIIGLVLAVIFTVVYLGAIMSANQY
jgi:hypothetical protein